MDRQHMQDTFRRAYEHEGSAFVEVLQNCNVFNDGVFSTITKKDVRDDMLIDLNHGQPILFGSEKQYGVSRRPEGVVIVEVAEVGIEYILVHDETIRNPSTAFSLSRLAKTPATPTPIGVFRAIDSGEFSTSVAAQIREVQAQLGRGDLGDLLRSQSTWEV
jgi:2-oxoglutarate ferredoxin oxidoreductase subunit beta